MMEAKDMVMGKKETLALADEGAYIGPVLLGYLKRVKKAQAEISFKAGRKEVVDWVKDNNALRDEPWSTEYTEAYGYDPMVEGDVILSYFEWQAKLKEWGISVD